jgi:hypothetical protein
MLSARLLAYAPQEQSIKNSCCETNIWRWRTAKSGRLGPPGKGGLFQSATIPGGTPLTSQKIGNGLRQVRATGPRWDCVSLQILKGSSALHSDLFLLAQPDRTLVCQDRARRHCARRVHVGVRLAEKAHEVHPALQQSAKDSKVELLRSYASHYSQFSCYGSLVII